MTATLELAVVRHGNTFGPGDAVTWVGRREDLPLVARGLEQAAALGAALAASRWRPERVLASSLARTRGHAARALEVAGWDLRIEADPRLDEIDYGPWGGLTSTEIEARGDGRALEDWSREARWPAAFAESEDEVRARVQGLARELAATDAGRALVVSSNGVLRYLLDLAPGELGERRTSGTFKLGTGRGGRLVHADGRWTVDGWDLAPEALAERLAPAAGGR